MKTLSRVLLGIAAVSFVAAVILLIRGRGADTGVPVVGMLAALAVASRWEKRLGISPFTFWVFAFLAAALFFPAVFTFWFGFNTQKLVVPLIQIIMFGMGTKLSIGDFVREFRRPKALVVGTVLVYTVMPLAGLLIAKTFGFSPEIAAGVILIGACPGGAASNVMAYLADGNVALSVSLTAFATLISPVVTPLLMKLFAGKLMTIPFLGMMMSILNMIVLPIAAGLVVNRLLRDRKRWLDKILPLFSMLAIILVVTVVVAHYRDQLLKVGIALVAAAIVHNFIGYILGYWGARAIGLNERDCRTVSIEVGLKNGSMGMGLALNVLKSSDASFAPIIFGKWMNISGSILAGYWRQHPADENKSAPVTEEA
jgi:BASS family bile acid:Na+ symporter